AIRDQVLLKQLRVVRSRDENLWRLPACGASPLRFRLPSIWMAHGENEKTEKITINLEIRDLGQIALLVQECGSPRRPR
ncbi:MAG: hypothetical protein ABSB59_18165, partial [Streptosporangiaceae bacterium]